MDNLQPIVKVIGYTKFLGVPGDLYPTASDEKSSAILDTQDCGSHGARLIECAGRTCYDSYGKGRPSADYHEHIKQTGHGSVTEHVSINFFLSNISRGCTHELVRHRVGTAISQRSTRYVQESESPYVHHPLIKEFVDSCEEHAAPDGDLLLNVISEAQIVSRRAYEETVMCLESWLINIKKIDKVNARKQARGAARGYLGNALFTEMVWSANVRTLRNFLELRASPFADAEIRVLANRIYEEALSVVPEYFNDYTKVPCPDGIGYGIETKFRKL